MVRPQAQKPEEESRDAPTRRRQTPEALQAPRLADSQEFPQQAAQVVGRGGDPVTLRHLCDPSQPGASHAARLADVRETPLDPLAAKPLQPASLAPFDPPAVVPHRPLLIG